MCKDTITRRNFLRGMAQGTAALSLPMISSCTGKTGSAPDTGGQESGEMTYRTNPRNNDKCSILGYGCMRFQMKNENGREVVDQDSVDELIDYAIKHGVNYFDTAPVYLQGQSEQAVGKALSRYDRSTYYLATKLSSHRFLMGNAQITPKEMYERSVALYEQSFKNLQTDYIDYYLVHNISDIEGYERRLISSGVLEFLKEERRKGRIRNIGCSVHAHKDTVDYVLQQDMDWDFVQIQMNYYDWAISSARNVEAEYLYNELTKRGIPITIMEPIQGGRLSEVDYAGVNELRARKPGSTAASWAFRFCATYENVLTVLSGMTYMEHLQENVRTFSPFEPLTDEEIQILLDTAQQMAEHPMIQCNACKYCMPCPYGLDIPAILTHYNKCLREGNIIEDTSDDAYRKARKAFLVGYDRSVPRLRQASHCAACGQCVPECPQSIDIPGELRKIDQYVEALKKSGPTF